MITSFLTHAKKFNSHLKSIVYETLWGFKGGLQHSSCSTLKQSSVAIRQGRHSYLKGEEGTQTWWDLKWPSVVIKDHREPTWLAEERTWM